MKGGAKVIIEAHRHEGVFIARSKEDALVTLNSTPGEIPLAVCHIIANPINFYIAYVA